MESLINFLATSNWLPTLAVVAATVGAAFALVATLIRMRAERRYLRIIRESDRARRVREMYSRYVADGRLSEDELSDLTEELERLALKLQRRERLYVMHALKQPSPIGRERYVDKLLEAA